MQEQLEWVQTYDGSYTLFNPQKNIHYRSQHGAVTESEYVFLKGSRLHQQQGDWSVLELGFGSATNFLLTAQTFLKQNQGSKLTYHTVEHSPISSTLFSQVKRSEQFASKELRDMAQKAFKLIEPKHQQTAKIVGINGQIKLCLYKKKWQDLQIPNLQADAVYHDPFDPSVNPDSWSKQCFQWSFDHIHPSGVLSTYGAASHARRAMAEVGFFIGIRKGSGKKREVTIASPDSSVISNFEIIRKSPFKPQITEKTLLETFQTI